ncbi:MAG: class I SAM-dependent methyltransferase [Myxococcales bacterium]|nr:class I SAM-dependent methyltransferase [Myxococcales bacterium]
MSEARHTFQADVYAQNARFVPALGVPAVDLLDPRPGERVLDLGAGDGALSHEIVARGAEVVALDASPSMVEAARATGLDARVGDAQALDVDGPFDAVFSNAALHWMPRADAVARGVFEVLRPGGRFVAELGGHGNCAAIRVALHAAIEHAGGSSDGVDPWYFPTAEAHRAVLERAGFVVESIAAHCRPTVLPTGFAGWMATFAADHLARVPASAREATLADAVRRVETVLVDASGRAVADYVRLRFRAHRPA